MHTTRKEECQFEGNDASNNHPLCTHRSLKHPDESLRLQLLGLTCSAEPSVGPVRSVEKREPSSAQLKQEEVKKETKRKRGSPCTQNEHHRFRRRSFRHTLDISNPCGVGWEVRFKVGTSERETNRRTLSRREVDALFQRKLQKATNMVSSSSPMLEEGANPPHFSQDTPHTHPSTSRNHPSRSSQSATKLVLRPPQPPPTGSSPGDVANEETSL